MRRRLSGLAVFAALVAGMGFWVAHAQTTIDIASVDEAAWWTQRPGAAAVGDGKFEVANSVRGQESVAALRVLIRGDITKATLVLAENSAPLASAVPGKLRVCTTTQPWLKVDAGKWADRPQPDCGSGVDMTRAVDPNGVGSWSGDVTAMLHGPRSEVSLMVLPADDQGSVLNSTWFMTLVPRIAADGIPDVTPTTEGALAPPTTLTTSGGVRPAAPSSTSAPAATTPTTAAAAAAAAPTPDTTPKRFQVAALDKPGKPWGKLVILVPLAALFALAYTWLQRRLTERSPSA